VVNFYFTGEIMSDIENLKQKQRAIMREKFLEMLGHMENRALTIQTYRGACVSGNFRSADYNILNWHVSNLNTPIGTVPEALLRTQDIVCIKFNMDE
jgi:gem associated protein 7